MKRFAFALLVTLLAVTLVVSLDAQVQPQGKSSPYVTVPIPGPFAVPPPTGGSYSGPGDTVPWIQGGVPGNSVLGFGGGPFGCLYVLGNTITGKQLLMACQSFNGCVCVPVPNCTQGIASISVITTSPSNPVLLSATYSYCPQIQQICLKLNCAVLVPFLANVDQNLFAIGVVVTCCGSGSLDAADSNAELALASDTDEVSLAAGGAQTLSQTLTGRIDDAGKQAAFQGPLFVTLLGSASGMDPGIAAGQRHVPLNADPYHALLLAGGEQRVLPQGLLSLAAPQSFVIRVPPLALAGLQGATLHHVAVVHDGQRIVAVSAAVALRLAP